jgi:hypothetical protein
MAPEKRDSRTVLILILWHIQNNISHIVCTRVYNTEPQRMSLTTFNLSATVRNTVTRVKITGLFII